jgi:hypothetical protein
MIDKGLTWGQLFDSLGLTPGIPAPLKPFNPSVSGASEIEDIKHFDTADKVALMAALLAPFFCPWVSWEDTFEVARAGESSPLMFRVFQERDSIASVLHLCKRLKSAPVLHLAYEGPKTVAEAIISIVEEASSSGDAQDEYGENFYSFFKGNDPMGSAARLRDFLKRPKGLEKPEIDLFGLVSAFPGWVLLKRETQPVMWASRQDELALILKNASLPNMAARQKLAVQMMQEAIQVFESQGETEHAAIAKSNLANLISRVDWLTVEERFRRAKALYDDAIRTATDRRFRALLMDNVAGQLGKAANDGFPVSRREALDLSTKAAEELEAVGELSELPSVLANVVGHLKGLKDETKTRKDDLQRGREIARRAIAMLAKNCEVPHREKLSSELKRTLADLLVRSVDFEPERREEFAGEALKILDSLN